MLKSKSFDVCKDAIALIIVILGYSKVDIEVLDTDMKTVEFNDCRRVSGNNRDANGMLAAMWEGARFSYKNQQKFINSFT